MERQFSNRPTKEDAGAARYLKVVIIIRFFCVILNFVMVGFMFITRDFMTHTRTSGTCMFEAKEHF